MVIRILAFLIFAGLLTAAFAGDILTNLAPKDLEQVQNEIIRLFPGAKIHSAKEKYLSPGGNLKACSVIFDRTRVEPQRISYREIMSESYPSNIKGIGRFKFASRDVRDYSWYEIPESGARVNCPVNMPTETVERVIEFIKSRPIFSTRQINFGKPVEITSKAILLGGFSISDKTKDQEYLLGVGSSIYVVVKITDEEVELVRVYRAII